jgi:glycosyltransferase involved in cell wall biosynthesis
VRLLLLSFIDTRLEHILKKVDDQYRELKRINPDTIGVIVGSSSKSFNKKNFGISYVNVGELNRLLPELDHWKVAVEIIESLKPDLIYMRYPLADQNLYRLVKRYPGKIIFEHQTKEQPELKTRNQIYWQENERKYGSLCLEKSAAVVAVTDEIKQYQQARMISPVPAETISNGIDVESIAPVTGETEKKNGTVNLLNMAVFDTWHGMERLIAGMAAYKGNRKILVHMVGYGDQLEAYKTFAEESGQTDRFVFYGQQNRHQIARIAQKCDAGIGVLAPHRKSLHDTVALKHREYAAMGLPFIFAGGDPDFPDSLPFVRVYPTNNNAIPPAELFEWLDSFKNRIETTQTIRNYAAANLTWKRKCNRLYSFLERLLTDSPEELVGKENNNYAEKSTFSMDAMVETIVHRYFKEAAKKLAANAKRLPLESYRLASLYKQMNQPDKAEELFKRLLENGTPPHLEPGICFHLGELNYRQNRREKALSYFKRCLQKAPEHKKAAAYLEADLKR